MLRPCRQVKLASWVVAAAISFSCDMNGAADNWSFFFFCLILEIDTFAWKESADVERVRQLRSFYCSVGPYSLRPQYRVGDGSRCVHSHNPLVKHFGPVLTSCARCVWSQAYAAILRSIITCGAFLSPLIASIDHLKASVPTVDFVLGIGARQIQASTLRCHCACTRVIGVWWAGIFVGWSGGFWYLHAKYLAFFCGNGAYSNSYTHVAHVICETDLQRIKRVNRRKVMHLCQCDMLGK